MCPQRFIKKEINMIGELNVGHQMKTIIWNFFKKVNATQAECNYCHFKCNYQTSTSNLLRHVRRKHMHALLEFEEKGKIDSPVPPSDEISMTSWADGSENGKTGPEEEQSSDIWSLFTRIDDTSAKCNLCQTKLSCENSITNLTTHWEAEHPGVLLKCDLSENELARNVLCHIPGEENCSSMPQNTKDSRSNDEPAAKSVKRGKRKSPGWTYFTRIDKTQAECKVCHLRISHLCVSNLMRHISRMHPDELLASAHNGEQRDAQNSEDDDDSDDDLVLEPQEQSSVSDVEEGYEEEVTETGKSETDARGSDGSPELPPSKRKKTENLPVSIESEDVSASENLQSSQEQNSVLKNKTRTGGDKRFTLSSYVWKVFTRLKSGLFQCLICGATMSKKSLASNLTRHIRTAHPFFKAAMQKKLAANEAALGNSRSGHSESPSGERGPASPIIHTFEKATHSDSEIDEPLSAGGASDSEIDDSPAAGGASDSEIDKPPTAGGASDSEIDEPPTAGGGSDSERLAQPESAGGIKRKRKKASESERPAKSKNQNRRNQNAEEIQTCLLNERFVSAVEEGNHLLISLQDVVERQGQALDRIVACLEGMSGLQKCDM